MYSVTYYSVRYSKSKISQATHTLSSSPRLITLLNYFPFDNTTHLTYYVVCINKDFLPFNSNDIETFGQSNKGVKMKNLLITVVMFFFLAGVAIAGTININTANKKALETLPGIGETKAEAIITYRKAQKFESVEELSKVKGIGDKTVKKLKKQITVKGK